MKKILFAVLLTAFAVSSVKADSVLNLKKSLVDNNIVVPETYDTDYEKMMQGWWENGYLEMERKNAGKVVEASDEVFADRLSKMPTSIEMPYNQVVGQWIRMYLKRPSMVENMLGLSLYYMPIFERALESRGMPLELKYLPVIESAMNPVAVSPAGAAGLWQFMPATGRGVGLEISSLVDERLDPIKSSEKAADYLKSLYAIYNDWSLAIAAYNCGPGNVNKALRRAGGRGGNDFWSIYRYMPSETRGYVPAFIAANYVMTYYNRHGISPALAKRPLITDTVHISNRVHFQQIAEVLDIPVSEIKLLNPQYRRNEIPGDIKPYALTLPSRQVLAYIMFEDSILNHRAEEFTRRRTVEPGESSSARQGGSGDSSKDYVVETTTKQVTTHYTVHKKESLGSIAHKFGVKAGDIQRWNGLKSSKVKRGQHLKIIQTKRVTVRRPKPKSTETDETDSEELVEIETDSDAVPNPPSHSSGSAKSGIPGESVSGYVPAPPAKTQKAQPVSVPGPKSSSSSGRKSDVP
ncbi:MAG: transglycosylase SLT domain-containing protein, partial [Muribaculaceae bacterium]|nr:transglycosylase SLT domain-containing protein [Muribaculaceae bacterium]